MTASAQSMVEQASRDVKKVSPADAQKMIADGAVVVDVREAAEVEKTGKVPGALAIPRGLLEFKADPASASREPPSIPRSR